MYLPLCDIEHSKDVCAQPQSLITFIFLLLHQDILKLKVAFRKTEYMAMKTTMTAYPAL